MVGVIDCTFLRRVLGCRGPGQCCDRPHKNVGPVCRGSLQEHILFVCAGHAYFVNWLPPARCLGLAVPSRVHASAVLS